MYCSSGDKVMNSRARLILSVVLASPGLWVPALAGAPAAPSTPAGNDKQITRQALSAEQQNMNKAGSKKKEHKKRLTLGKSK
jgi:hypothetical protein